MRADYMLMVESIGESAGTITVLFIGDTPYITDAKADYGVFRYYLTLGISKEEKPHES